MKKAFTLAEIMIALTVIGVITSILLPVAFQTTPDENIMKFKKGNATLAKVVNELVTSDKYYKDNDLGLMPDGTTIKPKTAYMGCSTDAVGDEASTKYFCLSFADMLNTKNVNCSTASTGENDEKTFVDVVIDTNLLDSLETWQKTEADAKTIVDNVCKTVATTVGAEITTSDNIIYYQGNPNATFGIYWTGCNADDRLFAVGRGTKKGGVSLESFYKVFCMDVDGINKGEEPFGYGIRADGKILVGSRAQQWIEKSIQDKD